VLLLEVAQLLPLLVVTIMCQSFGVSLAACLCGFEWLQQSTYDFELLSGPEPLSPREVLEQGEVSEALAINSGSNATRKQTYYDSE